jgi:hypothetical protein
MAAVESLASPIPFICEGMKGLEGNKDGYCKYGIFGKERSIYSGSTRRCTRVSYSMQPIMKRQISRKVCCESIGSQSLLK